MTLKPCPFCGGKAELQWVEEFYYCLSHVQCTACAARGQRSSNEAVAEEAWNARIIPEGYVKVVLCGQCKAWCLDGDQSNMVDDDGKDRRYCLISKRYMRVDDYCSKGEAKEDTNA